MILRTCGDNQTSFISCLNYETIIHTFCRIFNRQRTQRGSLGYPWLRHTVSPDGTRVYLFEGAVFEVRGYSRSSCPLMPIGNCHRLELVDTQHVFLTPPTSLVNGPQRCDAP
jgi:hypothetical protein